MPDPTITQLMELQQRVARLEQKSKARTGKLGPAYMNFLTLPFLRAFWPISSVNDGNGVFDVSGQGRFLTNNVGGAGSVYNSLIPIWTFNGTTGFISRANEAGLHFSSNMTIGGWFNSSAFPGAGATRYLMSKTDAATNIEYQLYENNNGGKITFGISSTGAAGGIVSVTSGGSYSLNSWYFAVGRFVGSTSLDVYLNYDGVNGKTSNTTTIPATIFNTGTAQFTIGSQNGAAGFFQGWCGACFMSAYPLPDALIARLFNMTRSIFSV